MKNFTILAIVLTIGIFSIYGYSKTQPKNVSKLFNYVECLEAKFIFLSQLKIDPKMGKPVAVLFKCNKPTIKRR